MSRAGASGPFFATGVTTPAPLSTTPGVAGLFHVVVCSLSSFRYCGHRYYRSGDGGPGTGNGLKFRPASFQPVTGRLRVNERLPKARPRNVVGEDAFRRAPLPSFLVARLDVFRLRSSARTLHRGRRAWRECGRLLIGCGNDRDCGSSGDRASNITRGCLNEVNVVPRGACRDASGNAGGSGRFLQAKCVRSIRMTNGDCVTQRVDRRARYRAGGNEVSNHRSVRSVIRV